VNIDEFKVFREKYSSWNNFYYGIAIPFTFTSIGQIFAGPFLGVKADMQNNPLLTMKQAFLSRYKLNNPQVKIIRGLNNLYKGNFWNYTYTLGCSLTGNNLVYFINKNLSDSKSYSKQAFFSGIAAGMLEAAWTTPIVARELNKTTSSVLPTILNSYKKLYPSLAFRDSIGWIVVQANAALLRKNIELEQIISPNEKTLRFFVSGVLASLLSSPADANLRRVFSDNNNRGPLKLFGEAYKKFGFFCAISAGWKPRVATVSPPYIAYGAAQHYLDKKLKTAENTKIRLLP
jgi:hypothetical protein